MPGSRCTFSERTNQRAVQQRPLTVASSTTSGHDIDILATAERSPPLHTFRSGSSRSSSPSSMWSFPSVFRSDIALDPFSPKIPFGGVPRSTGLRAGLSPPVARGIVQAFLQQRCRRACRVGGSRLHEIRMDVRLTHTAVDAITRSRRQKSRGVSWMVPPSPPGLLFCSYAPTRKDDLNVYDAHERPLLPSCLVCFDASAKCL